MVHEGLQGLKPRLRVDTSEQQPVYLLEGKNGAYMRLSWSAYELLRRVGDGESFEQIATSINERGGQASRTVDAPEIEEAYRKVIDRIAAIEARSGALTGPFWFRRRLISEALVVRSANAGAALYHPLLALLLVLATLVAAALTAARGLHVAAAHFWPAYGLFLVSLLFHELGHASACARFGARPSEIGFTFYLVYPAFYSNVSAAWTLTRWQRVVVDLGGVYFQIVVGAIYALVYTIHPWEPLAAALAFIAGSVVFSLNPILKFDGYWVVADALGVTNLGQQPARLVRHAYERLRGRAVKALPWSPAITVVLALYSATSFAFWVYFLRGTVPLLTSYAGGYADSAVALAHALAQAPPWPDSSTVMRFLTSTYMLAFLLVVLLRLARSLLGAVPARWMQRGSGGASAKTASGPAPLD